MSSPNAKKRIQQLLTGTYASNGYYGLADLTNAALIADIFAAPTYDDTDRTNLIAFFGSCEIPVRGDFPREAAELPAIIIQRTSSQESQSYLGDEMGEDEDLDSDTVGASIRGTNLKEQVSVMVWTAGAGGSELRDAMFLAVRELLIRGRAFLRAAGITCVEFTGGGDGQARRDGEELILYSADLTLSYLADLEYVVTNENVKPAEIISRAYDPTGYDGDPTDTGEVTFAEWEDDT